ncbi:MAG: shikimate dehydrogenase [Oleiphilaceae bacterium]|jgi:shikimate dehydrogenase
MAGSVIDNVVDKYAVVGNPIEHSKSPMIHAMFAKQTKQYLEYVKIKAPLDAFKEMVTDFFAQSHQKGLNITVPFKEQAWALCQLRTDRAELAGAVNTLYLNKTGQLCGDNTDGIGLVSDLKNHDVPLQGKKILVIGAGGAVRGVLQPILKEMPASVVLCNRTQSKADELVSIFKHLGNIKSSAFQDLGEAFDVVINGTSASLAGSLPPLPIHVIAEKTVAYDMMYSQDVTVFNAWAKQSGAEKAIDGLGMLVEQAAAAFHLWRGVRPETFAVMATIRALK